MTATEKIKLQCSTCGASVRASASMAGKQAKCPKCKGLSMFLPMKEEPATTPTPQPQQAEMQPNTEPCPLCDGDIKPGAKKCRHCGEWLVEPPQNKETQKNDSGKNKDIVACLQCGSPRLKKTSVAEGGAIGCVLLIIGLCLCATLIGALIGIPVILYALHTGSKRRGLWQCKSCGAQTNRKMGFLESNGAVIFLAPIILIAYMAFFSGAKNNTNNKQEKSREKATIPKPKAFKTPPAYAISKTRDLSFLGTPRKEFRIVVKKALSSKELKEIGEDIVSKNRNIHAISILCYQKGDDIDSFYTVGMIEWAPGGDWGRASDYGKIKNKFNIKIGSAVDMSFLGKPEQGNNLIVNQEKAITALKAGKPYKGAISKKSAKHGYFFIDKRMAVPAKYNTTGINSFFKGKDGKIYYLDAGGKVPELPKQTPPGGDWGEY